MKLLISVLWIGRMFGVIKRNKSLLRLQQQKHLLHHGIQTTAEIMDAFPYNEKTGNFTTLRLWMKLKRPDGTLIYTHATTLLDAKQIPVKGQTVKVKYLPDNLSSILIL